MTKIQKLEERVARDNKMCIKINQCLSAVNNGEMLYTEAIGVITSCLEMAGRREERSDDK